MKKRAAVLIFALALAMCSCTNGESGTAETAETTSETQTSPEETAASQSEAAEMFRYRLTDSGVYLQAYIGSEKTVTIPTEIDGQPVVGMYSKLFRSSPVEELVFPEGVTEISCFEEAYKLRKIVLPSTAETIDISELAELPEPVCIETAENGNFTVKDGTLFTADGKTLVYALECGEEYIVPEGTEKIGEFAFAGKGLRSVSFPSTLESIGKKAFRGCKKLLYVKLPSNVAEIGELAFYDSGLIEADIDEGVEKIGAEAFRSTDITEISLPHSIKEVGGYFVNDDCRVYAFEPMQSLYDYDIVFLNETTAERAERLLRPHTDTNFNGRIRIDIDFDGIAECFEMSEGMYTSIENATLFDFENDNWIWIDGSFQKLYHLYDKENDRDIYLSESFGDYGDYSSIYLLTPLDSQIECDWIGTFTNIGDSENENIEFGSLNGHFYIDENAQRPIDAEKYILDAMSKYELCDVIDFSNIAREHADEEHYLVELDPIEKRSSKPLGTAEEYNEEMNVRIGGSNYFKLSPSFYAYSEEGLKGLSELPDVTSLDVAFRLENAETLTKFSSLKELSIMSVKDTSALAKMDNIEILHIDDKMESYDFLSEMDGVKAISFLWAEDEPDDFFKILKDMKSLKYFLIYNYDNRSVSEAQIKWLRENMPELKIAYYMQYE